MISFSSSVYIVSTYILHVKFNDSCVISVSTRACMRSFLYKRHGAEDVREVFSLAIHYQSYRTYRKRSDLQIIYHRVQYRSHVQHCITRLLEYLQILLKGPTASQKNTEGKMALMEALNTASVVYSDGLSERSSCYDYCSSSVECSPGHSPSHRSLDHSNRLIMNDKDKGIYNSLGSSSSPHGKVRIA